MFHVRGLRDGDYGALYNEAETQPLLDAALDWIDGDEAHEAATPEPYEKRHAELKEKVELINADLFAKMRADEEARAKEDEKEREQWARERETEGLWPHTNTSGVG